MMDFEIKQTGDKWAVYANDIAVSENVTAHEALLIVHALRLADLIRLRSIIAKS
jgi:hypothetical protein